MNHRFVLLAAFALFAATPARAQPAPLAIAPGTVSTHATATRQLPNTVAQVSVAVEVHGRDVPGASAALAQRTNTLLAYLQSQHADRLRTVDVAVTPEVQEIRGQPDRITGYTGHGGVSFRITPDALPAVLAGCLNNGANAIGGIEFSPREEEVEAARRSLAVEATRRAMDEAKAVADAAGEHVAGVQSIEVGAPEQPMYSRLEAPAPAMMAAKAAPPIPTLPGDAAVSMTVSVTVRLGS